MEYRDKVFKDVAKALGSSTRRNLSTDEDQKLKDGMEGLELLNNFNLLMTYYDELKPYMAQAIEEIKKNKAKAKRNINKERFER